MQIDELQKSIKQKIQFYFLNKDNAKILLEN